MVRAAFSTESQCGSNEDEAEDNKGGGDKTGYREQRHHGAPTLGLERYVERSEREHSRKEQGQEYSANGQSPTLFVVQAAHDLAIVNLSAKNASPREATDRIRSRHFPSAALAHGQNLSLFSDP